MSGSRHLLITGGAGFIGSHLVDLAMARPGTTVTVLDKLTYAGDRENLADHEGDPRFRFVLGDVGDTEVVRALVEEADAVIHAAAESFVDRSIDDPSVFVVSNVVGTHVVLEACRLTSTPMVLVSTDEVYGSLTDGSFTEESPLRPNSPYSASKDAADLLCQAYVRTYGCPVVVVRGTNAYGPRQHPEKALPTFALAALRRRRLPVYGDGSNRREWLHVKDFAAAILTALDEGEPGNVYNIGGGHELTNLDLARAVCRLTGASESLIAFVEDRPGHDLRYSMTWNRLAAFGWEPRIPFVEGLAETIAWYRDRELAGSRVG